MEWPPAWLVAEAEKEGCEVRWDWQGQRLARLDDVKPIPLDGKVVGLLGVAGSGLRFGLRRRGQDINALLDDLAKDIERHPLNSATRR